MTAWLLALAVATLFVALQYGRPIRREGRGVLPPAIMRFAAIALLVALILDVRVGRDRPPAPIVGLDASLSWMRGDSTRWARALARARTLGADSVLLFGDSVRLVDETSRPADAASSLDALAEQATAQGRPLVIVTDGESTLPRDRLDALPRGSRVEVIEAAPAADLGVVAMEAPRALSSGDTLRTRVVVRAGSRAVPQATVTLLLADRVVGTAAVPRLEPHATGSVEISAITPGGDGARVLRAIAQAQGDAEPRNDTLAVAVDVTPAAGAVWVSSAPDLDGRAALGVLRGLGIPTRAFLRVAPGTWRVEGTLEPIGEPAVREAAAQAPFLVVHGDTAVFGPPRTVAGDAPLALMPGPARQAGPSTPAVLDEWYPTGAPASPAAGALGGIPWDSLPSVSLGAAAALGAPSGPGTWVAVEGKRARRGDAAPFVVGSESPRRIVVTRATGMWRWQARGGAGATAYEGLMGSLFDWLADARRDRRAAIPEQQSVRAGEPVRWRLASSGDSATRVVLTRHGEPASTDSMMLAPAPGTIFATSAPLAQGVYQAQAEGGQSILPVNAANELLPHAPTLPAGAHGRGPIASTAPALRDFGVAYAAIALLLCVEWVLRRRRGLR